MYQGFYQINAIGGITPKWNFLSKQFNLVFLCGFSLSVGMSL